MVMVADEDLSDVTIADQVACVRRELGFRESAYPRWIEQRRMTQTAADKQLRHLRAVLKTLLGIEGAL